MSKKMKFLGILLLAVVATSYSVSGTYAKYISKVELTDSARVAKWTISMSDPAMNTLSLFKDSYEIADGAVVDALDDTKVVAPGVHGQYTFSLNGTLETAFTLDVKAEVTDNVVLTAGTHQDSNGNDVVVAADYAPIQYSLDGTTWTDADGLEAALNNLFKETDGQKTVYAPQEITEKGKTTIYWKWAFDETDTQVATGFTPNSEYDTLLGNIGADTVSVKITVTAEQSKEQPTAGATL